MPFTPTKSVWVDQDIWINADYNQIIDDIETWLTNMPGSDLEAPLVLDRPGQNLNGRGNSIYGFITLMGGSATGLAAMRVLVDAAAHGATGDGATDDTAAIQAAIDSLPTTGGIVLLPPGTYVISETLFLSGSSDNQSNVTLRGFGDCTLITIIDSFPDNMAISAGTTARTGQRVMHLRIDGNSANQVGTPVGIDLGVSTRCAVFNVTFEDFAGDGVNAQGGRQNEIACCRIVGCDGSGIDVDGAVTRAYNYSISGNIVRDALNGVRFEGVFDSSIVGNLIREGQANGTGILLSGGGTSPGCQRIIASGNVIDDCYDGLRLETS